MKKLLLATATLIAFVGPTLAAGPGVPTGIWCQTGWQPGWMYFKRAGKRGKCAQAHEPSYTLVLKPNGDYLLDGELWVRCKVDPQSYAKGGWADYTCTDSFGETTKRTQKFVFDGRELGRSSMDDY